MTRIDELNRLYAEAEALLQTNWQAACVRFEQLAAAAEAVLKQMPNDVAAAQIAARSLYEVAEYYGSGEGKRSKARKLWQRGRSHLEAVLPTVADADGRARLLYLLGLGHFDEACMWECFNSEHLLAAFQAAFVCFEQAFAAQPDSKSALLAADSLRFQHQDNCTGSVPDEPTDYAYLQAADEWYERALAHADASEEGRIWFKRGLMYAWTVNEGQPHVEQAEAYLRRAVYSRPCHVQAACELAKLLLSYSVCPQPEQAAQAWAQVQTLMAYVRENAPEDAAAWWGGAAAFNELGCRDYPFLPDEYRAAQSWCVQAALLQSDDEEHIQRQWSGLIQGVCSSLQRQELLSFLAETELSLQRILPHHAEMVAQLHDEIAEFWSDYHQDAYRYQHPFTLPETHYGDADDEAEVVENEYDEAESQALLAQWLDDAAMPNRAWFAQWLLALYGDEVRYPAAIVQQWQDEYGDDDAVFTPLELFGNFFALDNALPDRSRLFAIDWKDSESLIAYAQEAAERFGISLQWSAQNREQDGPDVLLPLFADQIAPHAAVYSLDTGGDYYYIAVADRSQAARFERIAAQWQLGFDTVLTAAPTQTWLAKIGSLFKT